MEEPQYCSDSWISCQRTPAPDKLALERSRTFRSGVRRLQYAFTVEVSMESIACRSKDVTSSDKLWTVPKRLERVPEALGPTPA